METNKDNILRFFLYLDRKKNYFRDEEKLDFQLDFSTKNKNTPTKSTFRLNKFLAISNMFYMAKNNEQLFTNIYADKYGPVVYQTSKINNLKKEVITKNIELSNELKKYLKKIYKSFSKYSDKELCDFLHSDPHWYSSFEKFENKTGSKNIEFTNDSHSFYKERLSIYINEFKL